ncbi:hypothetical protein MY729_07900, partial [Haemophilus influenzae]
RESDACCFANFLAEIWVSPTFFSFTLIVSVLPETLICSSCSERLPSWLVELHKQHLPLALA